MRQLCITLLALAALFDGATARACGDKLLAIGGGVRFHRFHAARRASLLIYSASKPAGAPIDGARLQSALKGAVRHVQLARDRTELERALRLGQVDLVLVDFAYLPDISRQLQSAASRPAVVPIVSKRSKVDFAAARKEYGFAVKAGADDLEFLTAIDGALKAKSGANAKS